jgi:hypothetical protein
MSSASFFLDMSGSRAASLSCWNDDNLAARSQKLFFLRHLSGVYTGEKTLHIVAITSSADLKRWENFY